jgi:hypothetical protein
LRRAALALLLLLVLPRCGFGSRDRPSNKVFHSVGGAVSVLTRWLDDFNDFRPEFEREFILPRRLSVPQLDLFVDFKQPAIVDLKLRSIAETDSTLYFRYKDLRAYDMWLAYLDWSYFDTPQTTRSRREWVLGDFYLRKFTEHPVHLYWENLRFDGVGPFLTRHHEFSRGGVKADLRTDWGRVAIEVPAFTFEDKNSRRNEVRQVSYRAGYHKAWERFFLSGVYQMQDGELPFFRERYQFDDFHFDAFGNRLLGFSDLNGRVRAHYRSRPDEVVRNFHVVDGFLGDATLSITPFERSSVQIGHARKIVNTSRLNRRGIDEVDRVGVPTIAQLKAVNGYELTESRGVENWIKVFFSNWKRFSGHYRFAQLDTDRVPFSDVTAAFSTILLPHRATTAEYKLSWTPGSHFGASLGRTEETRLNENRDISTRHNYTDFYSYVVLFEHLTLGAGISWWKHITNRLIFRDQLTDVKTETFDTQWDFGNGFAIFSNLRHLGYEGLREATEHIAETGVRFANGVRTGFDGRISVTYDRLKDFSNPALSYRQASLNLGASTKF